MRLLLFGPAREAVGRAALDRPLAAEGATLGELVDAVAEEFLALRPVLQASRLAVNGRYASDRRLRLAPGDEIAVHPPYSGG